MCCESLEETEHRAGASIHLFYHFLFAVFLLYSLDTIPELNNLFYGCSPKYKFKHAVQLLLLDLRLFPQYILGISKNYLAVSKKVH